MNRTVASVVFGVGVIVLIAGVAKILPGGMFTGGALAFLGALFFALSFIPRPEAEPNAPAPLSAFERISGLFFEPSRVFETSAPTRAGSPLARDRGVQHHLHHGLHANA